MGISERKERQKAELRDAILAAARRIIVAEGAEALTMRKIADAIEYSPGTIYLYFANREEIALALVREGFGNLLTALEPARPIADPIERIRAIGRAYIAFGLNDPQTYKLIFMESAAYIAAAFQPSANSDDTGQQAFDVLVEAVVDAVASGQFLPVEPQHAAQAFWSAFHGALSLHIACPSMLADVSSVAALLGDAVLDGLRP